MRRFRAAAGRNLRTGLPLPALAAAFCCALALSGCGKGGAAYEAAKIFAANSAKKITFEDARGAFAKGRVNAITSLDRHCRIAGAAQKRLVAAAPQTRVMGVGLRIAARGKFFEITQVMRGSSAEKAGLAEGDRLLAVNGMPVAGLPAARVREMTSASSGGDVDLAVSRVLGGLERRLQFSVRREIVEVPIATSAIYQQWAGYLRMTSFALGSAAQARREMADLHAAGIQAVLLDLRFNKGGLPAEAADFLRLFTGGKKTLFREISDKAAYRQSYEAGPDAQFGDVLVMVLVNGKTAGCAEIAAQSLRENTGALVAGSRTAGEGGTQRMFNLPDDKGLWMTVSYLVPPSGRAIEEAGIIPDMTITASAGDEARIEQGWSETKYPVLNDPYFREAVKTLAAKAQQQGLKMVK
ncbi:MAG: S41 family peptidase [Elusimicrobiales bacterium]